MPVRPDSGPIRIGVIADTHLAAATPELRRLCTGPFRGVSMILHAGDLTRIEVLDAFPGTKVVAVRGNMDRAPVAERYPEQVVVEAGGYRIGLIHGWGGPRRLEEKILEKFEDAAVDVIVYGHTHRSANHVINGILMFNPGAFSGTFLFRRRRSVGVLTVTDGIRGEIVPL